ncbi:hypothetical protein SORBI_3008G141000 [Sorghum bicolor]|uniref:Uncharacterized protein n=1 Tax=Sorghum bicolor TaxID=4558 RepID=A0A1Z5R751_SORBI|nr:hypothetical protein SORBI_3008G141000 [Sorghum bicolor]
MELIVEARSDPALISSAVVLSAAALGLIVFKAPGGIFLRLHGSTPADLWPWRLSAAGWCRACDVDGWHAAGKTVLWVSLMTLVLVLALGGLALLK